MIQLTSNNKKYSGNIIKFNLPENDNKVSIFYTLTNAQNVVNGTKGTRYVVEYKVRDSSTWFNLETYPNSGIQVSGTLSNPGVDRKSVLHLGFSNPGDAPLLGGLEYRVVITNDNVSGVTTVDYNTHTSFVPIRETTSLPE
jgi:hypothetical protein